jgi:hypothetical protein
MDLMSQGPESKDMELRRLHAEADARERDIDDMDARDIRNDTSSSACVARPWSRPRTSPR